MNTSPIDHLFKFGPQPVNIIRYLCPVTSTSNHANRSISNHSNRFDNVSLPTYSSEKGRGFCHFADFPLATDKQVLVIYDLTDTIRQWRIPTQSEVVPEPEQYSKVKMLKQTQKLVAIKSISHLLDHFLPIFYPDTLNHLHTVTEKNCKEIGEYPAT